MCNLETSYHFKGTVYKIYFILFIILFFDNLTLSISNLVL